MDQSRRTESCKNSTNFCSKTISSNASTGNWHGFISRSTTEAKTWKKRLNLCLHHRMNIGHPVDPILLTPLPCLTEMTFKGQVTDFNRFLFFCLSSPLVFARLCDKCLVPSSVVPSVGCGASKWSDSMPLLVELVYTCYKPGHFFWASEKSQNC